jgi:hypothetical protein
VRPVNFDWNNESNELSDDHLRVELKKALFPYIGLAETTEKPVSIILINILQIIKCIVSC